MSKSLDISEELYAVIESHRRDDEEVEATLRRLVAAARAKSDESDDSAATGPHPSEVAGIISSETAEKMRERIDGGAERDAEARRELRERLE